MSHSLRAAVSAAGLSAKIVPSSSPFTMTSRGARALLDGVPRVATLASFARGRALAEWTVAPSGSMAGRTRERPRISSESA